jgi:hypothetical protein
MDILARLKSLFARGPVEPLSARKLNAGNDAALATSIEGLRPGERAWITFEEGRALFSAMDDQYAFGELDEPGKLNLGAFAADHYVELDFRPIEGRIYFTRPAPPDFRKKGRPRRPKFWRLPKEGHLDRTPLDPAHRINSPYPWGRWAHCLVSRVFLPPA